MEGLEGDEDALRMVKGAVHFAGAARTEKAGDFEAAGEKFAGPEEAFDGSWGVGQPTGIGEAWAGRFGLFEQLPQKGKDLRGKCEFREEQFKLSLR